MSTADIALIWGADPDQAEAQGMLNDPSVSDTQLLTFLQSKMPHVRPGYGYEITQEAYELVARTIEARVRLAPERASRFLEEIVGKRIFPPVYTMGVVLGLFRTMEWIDNTLPGFSFEGAFANTLPTILLDWSLPRLDKGSLSGRYRSELSKLIKQYVNGKPPHRGVRRHKVFKVIERFHEQLGNGDLWNGDDGIPLNAFIARELLMATFLSLSDGGKAHALVGLVKTLTERVVQKA